jgi:hypothetical protein
MEYLLSQRNTENRHGFHRNFPCAHSFTPTPSHGIELPDRSNQSARVSGTPLRQYEDKQKQLWQVISHRFAIWRIVSYRIVS